MAYLVIFIIAISVFNIVRADIKYRSEKRKLEEERNKRIRKLEELRLWGINPDSLIENMKK